VLRVKTAALEEVPGEGIEDLIQGASALPEAITTVAGLMGGIALGKIGPRDSAANLPKDAIQDRTGMDGRPAAHCGNGRGWRVAFGNYGLDERPLLVGEVHGVI